MRGLTFELTPTTEVGAVSPGRDDAPRAAAWAYSACRSGSAVERGVMQHLCGGRKARLCEGYRGFGDFTSGAELWLLARSVVAGAAATGTARCEQPGLGRNLRTEPSLLMKRGGSPTPVPERDRAGTPARLTVLNSAGAR
jgi:hypothetical protein